MNILLRWLPYLIAFGLVLVGALIGVVICSLVC